MRDMTYNIMNKKLNAPLCWDDRAIDFESEAEATAFALTAGINLKEEAEIRYQIFYYDGGYISGKEAFRLLNEELKMED